MLGRSSIWDLKYTFSLTFNSCYITIDYILLIQAYSQVAFTVSTISDENVFTSLKLCMGHLNSLQLAWVRIIWRFGSMLLGTGFQELTLL